LKRYVVIRHASALNYEVKKPRSKQKELADVLKNKRFVRDKKWMVTANVFISVEKSENNVKNSEHVVVAKQMVDEEQIPRDSGVYRTKKSRLFESSSRFFDFDRVIEGMVASPCRNSP
jgi:hypothetical protein